MYMYILTFHGIFVNTWMYISSTHQLEPTGRLYFRNEVFRLRQETIFTRELMDIDHVVHGKPSFPWLTPDGSFRSIARFL